MTLTAETEEFSMTWFKVDDGFIESRKVRRLGPDRAAPVGVWTLCGVWSAGTLSDGFVPWEVVERYDSTRGSAKRLIDVGLWFETSQDGEEGVQFHDWQDYQPTRDQVEQRRKAETERKAKARESRRVSQLESPEVSRRDNQGDTPRESGQESALPDPTRPDPSLVTTDAAQAPPTQKRATRIPEGFTVTEKMITWSRERTPGVDWALETEKFVNYWQAKGGQAATKRDWLATWRNWMLNAAERTPTRAAPRRGPIVTPQGRILDF